MYVAGFCFGLQLNLVRLDLVTKFVVCSKSNLGPASRLDLFPPLAVLRLHPSYLPEFAHTELHVLKGVGLESV